MGAVLVALGMIWGFTIPLTKTAVSTGHQPLGLIFWQLLIATVTLSVISIVRRVGPVLNRRALIYFLVVGLLGTIFPNSFSYLAASHLPAGVMGIAIASVPMFSLGIALGLRLEKPSLQRGIGVLLGAGAVILLIGPQTSLPDPDQAVFVLVALIAPFCYGAEGHYIAARAPPDVDAIMTLLGASAIGCVIAGPLALASGGWVDPFVPWQNAEWALLLSSLCHVAAYTGYIWLVGKAGAVFASQMAYVVTVSAVLFSALMLSEIYSGWVWSALALMLAGMALVQPRGARGNRCKNSADRRSED
jgi:drug/metabolite transporter (DMT)-like permease